MKQGTKRKQNHLIHKPTIKLLLFAKKGVQTK